MKIVLSRYDFAIFHFVIFSDRAMFQITQWLCDQALVNLANIRIPNSTQETTDSKGLSTEVGIISGHKGKHQ